MGRFARPTKDSFRRMAMNLGWTDEDINLATRNELIEFISTKTKPKKLRRWRQIVTKDEVAKHE